MKQIICDICGKNEASSFLQFKVGRGGVLRDLRSGNGGTRRDDCIEYIDMCVECYQKIVDAAIKQREDRCYDKHIDAHED